MMDTPPESKLVGLVPWLPWPLSAWRWWTEPVRAENLAVLRIGVTLCMLIDVALTYAPAVNVFFGPGHLGDPEWFAWLRNSPRLSWSLLHGVGDPLLSLLAFMACLASTGWLLFDHVSRCFSKQPAPPARISLWIWLVVSALLVAGVWSRTLVAREKTPLLWALPATLVGLAAAWLFLHSFAAWHCHRPAKGWFTRVLLLLATCGLLAAGIWLSKREPVEPASLGMRLLGPWHTDPQLLRIAVGAWLVSALLLLVGLWTRPAAFAAWALALSFGHLNLYIDNAGDTVRGIILFYLMLTPCGAAWSLDAWWKARKQPATIALVSPWALRMLFLQMTLIYFLNGLYKLLGASWWTGDTLYFVLGDIALARVSPLQIPQPLWLLRLMTWGVMAWEVLFPLLVLAKWPRRLALFAGVAFHLGIFATMEIGGFVPYMLCLYLPLLPWDDWLVRKRSDKAMVTPP
jgi:hypothetical protein